MDLEFGSTATITCAFNGYPVPAVSWKKDDQEVVDNERMKITSCATSSFLEIVRLGYPDEGTYTCALSNVRGQDTASMLLSIHGAWVT